MFAGSRCRSYADGGFLFYTLRESNCSVRWNAGGREKPRPTQNNWKTWKSLMEEIAMETEASKHDPILEQAWQQYANLDVSANRRAKGFYDSRRRIALLGVLAIVLALLNQQFFLTFDVLTPPPPGNEPFQGYYSLGLVVRGLFIIVATLAAAFAASATRSYSAGSWLTYRAAAEEVKEATYIYRTILPKDRSRRAYLKKRLGEIQQTVMSNLGAEYTLDEYKGPLPSSYWPHSPDSDPGFGDLTGDEYVKYRLKNQLDWHSRKILQRKGERSQMNTAILAVGLLGALLAALGGFLAIWVVLTISILSALLGWQELRKVDETIKNYSDLVVQLSNLYDHWQNLEPEERTPEEFEKIVLGCERILRGPDRHSLRPRRESVREMDVERDAALINEIIQESADSAQRTKEKMLGNIVETMEEALPSSEQSVDETSQAVLGERSEEASSEIVQQELDAMGEEIRRRAGELPPFKLEEVSVPSIAPNEVKKTMAPDISTRPGKAKRNKLFISYSHHDKDWLAKVQPHIEVLENMDIAVNLWDDTQIKAGMKWREEIEKALASAKVAVLLVSTSFLNSDFISRDEVPALLKAAQEDGATILPLILRPCLYKSHPKLKEYQAVNDPSRPLSTLRPSKQEEIFVALSERIRELMEQDG